MKGRDRDGSEFSARDQIERIQPQDLHTVTFEVRLFPAFLRVNGIDSVFFLLAGSSLP
jgi:hypothetical protein